MIHQASQGLASLGRNGDSMLVHMSPKEVAGLQGLAMAQGGSLTVNPDTGLPEAFNLGNFFTSLLPTLAGVALAPYSGGSSLIPILGGVATGAAVAGAKGEDLLTGGLMGGLGGFGGGGLGKSLMGLGGAGAATPAISSGQGVQLTANNLTAPAISNPNMVGQALDKSVNNLSSTLTNPLGTGTGGAGINLNPMMNQGSSTNLLSGIDKVPGQAGLPISSNALDLARPPSGFESLMSGAGKLASDPFGQFDAFKAAGGSGYQLGAPLAMAGLSAMQPAPTDMSAEEAKRKAEENKYRDPRTGLLNLTQASPNFGTTFMAIGGAVNTNPSVGGGLSDLYNRPEGATTQSLSADGYGIGRLDRLAQQESLNHAKTLGYDMGGPVAFAKGGHQGYLDGEGDGMSDSIPATIEGKQPARLADGEFVVPADVVSHIGNGSSKAGSKRLYAMLDRVRKARVGHTKQGKQIKPEKYMPA